MVLTLNFSNIGIGGKVVKVGKQTQKTLAFNRINFFNIAYFFTPRSRVYPVNHFFI
jgi:hypothetical protein